MTSPNWSFHDYRNNMNRHVVGRLHRMHLRPDVINPFTDLTPYRLLITQQQYTLEEGDFLERIMPWVENGGTWVVGPHTDIFTKHAAKYKNAPFGHLEDWANITRLFYAPAPSKDAWGAEWHAMPGTTDVILSDGFLAHTDPLTYDAYQPGEGVSVLGTYAEGGDDYLPGHAAITETRVGQGRIIMLGCQLDEAGFRHFIGTLCAECGIAPIAEGSDSIQNSILTSPAGEIFTAIESSGKDGEYYTVLPFDAVDIFTARTFSAGERVEMKPYECIFARKN
jgi:beta-galactosidase GanA